MFWYHDFDPCQHVHTWCLLWNPILSCSGELVTVTFWFCGFLSDLCKGEGKATHWSCFKKKKCWKFVSFLVQEISKNHPGWRPRTWPSSRSLAQVVTKSKHGNLRTVKCLHFTNMIFQAKCEIWDKKYFDNQIVHSKGNKEAAPEVGHRGGLWSFGPTWAALHLDTWGVWFCWSGRSCF